MSTSPELGLLELALRPVVTVRLTEDQGRVREEGEEEEACRTPTSEESRLPAEPRICPPAPRKPRRVLRYKRRLSELEFIVVGADEMERLFRSRDRSSAVAPVPQVSKKQKCHE